MEHGNDRDPSRPRPAGSCNDSDISPGLPWERNTCSTHLKDCWCGPSWSGMNPGDPLVSRIAYFPQVTPCSGDAPSTTASLRKGVLTGTGRLLVTAGAGAVWAPRSQHALLCSECTKARDRILPETRGDPERSFGSITIKCNPGRLRGALGSGVKAA